MTSLTLSGKDFLRCHVERSETSVREPIVQLSCWGQSACDQWYTPEIFPWAGSSFHAEWQNYRIVYCWLFSEPRPV